MRSLRCFACIVMVLLICARTETRPLRPTIERRNPSLLLKASSQVAKEALARKLAVDPNEPPKQPERIPPGGPDSHHHDFINKALP
ncbi:hypothetical protein CJ030_MR2G011232 [Morella rubra]|uniref:Uncharacterized protein n=1 Tax=Morella rubra TaxID=262757 RepID=A0A6A1WFA9_9ROSI|nr:hypothetical protein CJ030_MR2G011232 [Morella rubra]